MKTTRPARTRKRSGFTLVEVMTVAAIIGLLASISLPAVTKARSTTQTQLCRNNLRLIEDAMSEVMVHSNFTSTASLTTEMIDPYVAAGSIANMDWPKIVLPPSDEVIQASETNGLYVTVDGERIELER